jgi:predicted RNA polymerase sigma factor
LLLFRKDVYSAKGDVLYDLGRYNEAIVAYNQAVELDTSGEYAQHLNEMKELIKNKK